MSDFNDAVEICPLLHALRNFKKNQAKLQDIYQDTLSLVNSTETFDLSTEYEQCQSTVLQSISFNKSLSVNILGDNYSTKSSCVNWLLCEDILPTHCEDWTQRKQQVTVKHGTNYQVAVSLPENYLIPVDKQFTCSRDVQAYLAYASGVNTSDDTVNELADINSNGYGIEILMDKAILAHGLKIILHHFDKGNFAGLTTSFSENTFPVFVIALDGGLSKNVICVLKLLVQRFPNSAVLLWFACDKQFVRKSAASMVDPTNLPLFGLSLLCIKASFKAHEASINALVKEKATLCGTSVAERSPAFWSIQKVLSDLHYDVVCSQYWNKATSCDITDHFTQSCDGHIQCCNDCLVPPFFSTILQLSMHQLLSASSTVQNSLHNSLLEKTISKVYSLSRDVLITPKRIAYAQCQEEILYKKLLDIATHNQIEIMNIITSVKEECTNRIMQLTESYDAEIDENGIKRPTTMSSAAKNIQNFVLQHVKIAAAEKLNNNINVLRDSVTGTLSRCLVHLESFNEDDLDSRSSAEASMHLKMILNAAYNVEINVQSSSSLLRIVLDKLRQVLYSLSWRDTKALDSSWKCKVAENVLDNLSESKLAKHMCSQFRTQLSQAHESFVSSLHHLQLRVQTRLEKEESERHHASKILAPQIAQLALRSRSFVDELRFGMPSVGKEIGRGMYGVVFSCMPWGNAISKLKKCAIKSVVPHDEKHWNDLSLEFYYSISLPPHPRIVELYGSVIDYNYGGGSSDQAVLLVMERMLRDLHCAIKRGIHEVERMRIGLDVMEGIRYLHSQGLVHRDIKLKNILLDSFNRAKISDLGFCKPSAMMSGSIVGTPIHMPPELFSGQYDNSVDIYAFGVLFWHLCAGSVHIPKHYRNCATKDHLWTAVRKGTRPERLSCFRNECWLIMKDCWQQDPAKRPLPGIVLEKLKHVWQVVIKEKEV